MKMKSRELIVREMRGIERTFIVSSVGDGSYQLDEVIGIAEHGTFRRKWQAINAIDEVAK